jgi:RES domain-containing protein
VEIKPATHVGWDAMPAGLVSIDWGTHWARTGASAVACVPSVVVPQEYNLLINPSHPDAGKIAATKVGKWMYDPRLRAA